jgi:acyl carrier protein
MTSLFVDPNLFSEVKSLLAYTLGLQQVPASWGNDMALVGHLPDLDSMNIVNLVAALEEHFGIEFTDDDMTMSTFGALKTLVETVHSKLSA